MPLDIELSDIPEGGDTTPSFSEVVDSGSNVAEWYDPLFPFSTKEHPFGFFNKSDGSPNFEKPRTRRPNKSRDSTPQSVGRTPTNPRNAEAAASVLARLNSLLGMGLGALGLQMTKEQLALANVEFETMAKEALLADPVLTKKILSVGASSGKAQLGIAYAMLGGAIAPVAMMEFKKNRVVEGEVT